VGTKKIIARVSLAAWSDAEACGTERLLHRYLAKEPSNVVQVFFNPDEEVSNAKTESSAIWVPP
jgi:hypothetical protein